MQSQIYAATKWCIFKTPSVPITRDFVLDAVKERCRRLSGTVQLLQFHWHDYSSPKYLEVIAHLVDITHTNSELVSAIGLCNFDAEHTEEVCQYLLAKNGKVDIVSNQVQFSVIDSRPLKRMVQVCEKYGLKLLTYGSFVSIVRCKVPFVQVTLYSSLLSSVEVSVDVNAPCPHNPISLTFKSTS